MNPEDKTDHWHGEIVLVCGPGRYTREGIRKIGEDHGTVGIARYPPALWGTGDEINFHHLETLGMLTWLDELYEAGYQCGREKWKEGEFGHYPDKERKP